MMYIDTYIHTSNYRMYIHSVTSPHSITVTVHLSSSDQYLFILPHLIASLNLA